MEPHHPREELATAIGDGLALAADRLRDTNSKSKPDEQRASATDLNRLLAAGSWRPKIGARFPLSQAAAAHRLQEENTLQGANTMTGKIVLNVEA
jgi:NADPH:quinone reductase-like Zn-dependent oxidoreductase